MFDTSYGYAVKDGGTVHVFEDKGDMDEFIAMFEVDTASYNKPQPCIIHHFNFNHGAMRQCAYDALDKAVRADG